METCKKCKNYGSENPCCCCDGVNGFSETKSQRKLSLERDLKVVEGYRDNAMASLLHQQTKLNEINEELSAL